jgi:hypothetical protein
MDARVKPAHDEYVTMRSPMLREPRRSCGLVRLLIRGRNGTRYS